MFVVLGRVAESGRVVAMTDQTDCLVEFPTEQAAEAAIGSFDWHDQDEPDHILDFQIVELKI